MANYKYMIKDKTKTVKSTKKSINLNMVTTPGEATKLWNIDNPVYIRKLIERNEKGISIIFKKGEIRKSGGTWLISINALIRILGPMPASSPTPTDND